MNRGHEFLQVTAPDTGCGLVYVRGAFDNNPGAILARAQQKKGGRSSFGIKAIENQSGYRWGPINHEGLLNFRWPYISQDLSIQGCEIGALTRFAFVRHNAVYQVIRFAPGALLQDAKTSPHEPDAEPLEPHITAPSKRHGKLNKSQPAPQIDRTVQLRLGGRLRFGCPCEAQIAQIEHDHVVEKRDTALMCTIGFRKQRLEMRLFVDGEVVNIVGEKETPGLSTEVDAVYDHEITLTPGKVTLIVCSFKFCDAENLEVTQDPMPTSGELREALGVSAESEYATDLAWMHQIDEVGGWNYYDCCKKSLP